MTARPSADKLHATVPERRCSFSSAPMCPEKFSNSVRSSLFPHLKQMLIFVYLLSLHDNNKHNKYGFGMQNCALQLTANANNSLFFPELLYNPGGA